MGRVKDWIVRRSMGEGWLKKGRFLSVSPAVAPQQWNARSLLGSLLAAALLDSLGYYQMAVDAGEIEEEHGGRGREKEGE